jgi:hypothetical protein
MVPDWGSPSEMHTGQSAATGLELPGNNNKIIIIVSASTQTANESQFMTTHLAHILI